MLERVLAPDGLVLHRSPRLARLGVPHLFTTRRGPAGAPLDVVTLDRDPALAPRLLREAGARPDARVVHARQVHGAGVWEVEGELPAAGPEADVLVTSRPDRALLVYTADCVPVLVARRDGARVAAVHAGWRGLVAGAIPRALEALGEGELVAAIGPCLSLARFEVGPEVADAFRAAELAGVVREGAGERPHVDLRAAVRLQLERAGVRELDVSDRCTWDDPELWSHRRDVTHGAAARAGRLGAVVAPVL